MRISRKSVVLMAVYGLIIAVVLINVLAYVQARAMTHFTTEGERTPRPEELTFRQKFVLLWTGVNIPRPHSSISVTDLGSPWTSIKVTTSDFVTLGAWFCPASDTAPLVIVFHGYAEDKSTMLPEAKALLEMGISVMLVDFRGSGESSESYTTIGYQEALDVAAATTFAVASIKPRRLIVYGASMGGAAVLKAVNDGLIAPDGIIIESVFDRMVTTIGNRFEAAGFPAFPAAEILAVWGGLQFGFNAFTNNPVEFARQVHCPALFIHGTADTRAKLGEGKKVFEAVTSPKFFVEFQGSVHTSLMAQDPSKWRESILAFLKLMRE